MADERASYLPELAAMLAGPSVGRASAGAPARPTTLGSPRYVVVPSASRPRVLVPDRAPRAAAAALRYSVEAAGSKARLRRTALATMFRLGVGVLLCRDRLAANGTADGVDVHLSDILGQPVLLGVHIGPARANRKPVLVLLDAKGKLQGFAKLGVNELTRSLVDAEAAALRRLATVDLGPVTVPAVLHHGRWGEHALLVQSALPVWLPRGTPAAAEQAEQIAMAAVAGSLGIRQMPFAGSPFAARLGAAVRALDASDASARSERIESRSRERDASTASAGLAAVLEAVSGRTDPLPFGSWHGDWSGTNSAVLADGRVLVWDWERFDTDVPVGFDALHLALQGAITRQSVPPFEAAHALFEHPPAGVPAGVADIVTALYLVHLGTRYLHDRQAEAGVRLGRVGEWLLPVLAERWGGGTK